MHELKLLTGRSWWGVYH